MHTHDIKPQLYGVPAARLARVPRVIHTKHFAHVAHVTPRQIGAANFVARWVDDYVCVSEDSAQRTVAQGMPDEFQPLRQRAKVLEDRPGRRVVDPRARGRVRRDEFLE